MSADLHEVIEDSISDAELPSEPVEAPESTEAVETAPEATEAIQETSEVSSPATKLDQTDQDEFEKKFGIPSQSVSGRENRIPYSRVKKITEKAISDAKKEWEATSSPKTLEYETKIKDYEGRLDKVAQFEQVMLNDQPRFLQMLGGLPQYKDILAPLFSQQKPAQAETTQVQQQQQLPDDMPAPDQKLPDGTMVYSLDGLKSLLTWNSKQARQEAVKDVEKRYKPMEDEWMAHQKLQTIIPQVQAQITEARKWPMFNENEDDIVKALQVDQKLSLEGAYQKVVYPKLIADRNKMREDLLREIKSAPVATSAPTRQSKPVTTPAVSSGPRNLEDVINEAIQSLK